MNLKWGSVSTTARPAFIDPQPQTQRDTIQSRRGSKLNLSLDLTQLINIDVYLRHRKRTHWAEAPSGAGQTPSSVLAECWATPPSSPGETSFADAEGEGDEQQDTIDVHRDTTPHTPASSYEALTFQSSKWDSPSPSIEVLTPEFNSVDATLHDADFHSSKSKSGWSLGSEYERDESSMSGIKTSFPAPSLLQADRLNGRGAGDSHGYAHCLRVEPGELENRGRSKMRVLEPASLRRSTHSPSPVGLGIYMQDSSDGVLGCINSLETENALWMALPNAHQMEVVDKLERILRLPGEIEH